MMSKRFFYLYLIAGIIALLMLVYRLIFAYSTYENVWIVINIIAVIALFYMAYKVHLEKRDHDMM